MLIIILSLEEITTFSNPRTDKNLGNLGELDEISETQMKDLYHNLKG